MITYDLIQALEVTRNELSHWHCWRISNYADYRASSGAAQCSKVLAIAEHAIETGRADLDDHGPAPSAEAISSQAARIRDLVTENKELRRDLEGMTRAAKDGQKALNCLRLCVARLEEYPDAEQGIAIENARLLLGQAKP